MRPYGYIYKLTNTLNQWSYIGQTVNPPYLRWLEHIDGKQDSYVSRAIRKYGAHNFNYEIIDVAENQDELNSRELYWSRYYHTWVEDPECQGYNVRECGGAHGRLARVSIEKMIETKRNNPPSRHYWRSGEEHCWYGRHHSEESKAKISASRKGKCVGQDNGMFGKKHTDETKLLLSQIATQRMSGDGNPMYGKTHSDVARQKMREAHHDYRGEKNPNAVSIRCIETGVIYPCMKDAAKAAGVSLAAISNYFHLNRKTCGGYTWEILSQDQSTLVV